MPDLYYMNGDRTNAVGMNGTSFVGMNGTETVLPINSSADYSTSVVFPNGTNSVLLNGTNSVILNADEVANLNGEDIQEPLNATSADHVNFWKLGVMYGDPIALQGYDVFNGKAERQARKKRREERKAARTTEKTARRERRKERFQARQERLKSGGGFFQKLGAGLEKAGAGVAELVAKKDEVLQDLGFQPNEAVLEQRAAQMAAAEVATPGATRALEDAGVDTTGGDQTPVAEPNWWSKQDTVTKAAIIGGGLVGAYLLYNQFSKKKRRK
jgi:hypothetical protein